ncbi:transglutaminase domain-containing protein [Paenibacillus montanisoli]|uniref:Transglutaminase domain-containing protein n=1 Tax=Paenibacillus montanisoli TaxID=2081970 RepID=A0A328UAS2_9BACL|nr:transglutaminase domain-containing protein [Paenibacillus montanisoli]RAP78025.1 transglutaminase domain-containing protein [Paenibacillus montanisoli]
METKNAVFSLDRETQALIERKFEEKRKLAAARDASLFGVFGEPLSEEERWALKFLYAYMPLHDLADYDGSLFLSHVRQSLESRAKLPWGKLVPDHLFLHFVLPYRVNNENIEDSRGILYRELKDRVERLSMEEAILETNHWCYEKATYVGNDPRTVSPLTLIRATLGRCGEESTLAVAALRSLCIPARQCYTPRWAHSDSNHAWVEAWANGKWHFIGACEPEPALNQGWFSAPAKRAMLVNTRVSANYPGPEPVTLAHEWYTEINLLDGYAPSRTITVRVVDADGEPIPSAAVSFQVYNFAEFSPIAKMKTNERGEVRFTTGYGDLLVRAVNRGAWGELKLSASVRQLDAAEIVVDRHEQPDGVYEFDMVPPPELPVDNAVSVTAEEALRHQARMREGAAIRQRFEETFHTESQAGELAAKLGLPADRVWEMLRIARGNSGEIAAFLEERTPEYGEWPLRLLESLNKKDLTDTFRRSLDDHLIGPMMYAHSCDTETFTRYVLCPRVLFEMITPYRSTLREAVSPEAIDEFRNDPAEWAGWLTANFEVVPELAHYEGMAAPAGSIKLLKGDRLSRDILFVAGCRSFGIAARLHPSERKPQYRNAQGDWLDAQINDGLPIAKQTVTGQLKLLPDPAAPADQAASAYYRNFTLAKLAEGSYQTLHYPHGQTEVHDLTYELEPGSYRMTAGTRLQDGSVLVRFTYFNIQANRLTELVLSFRSPMAAELPLLAEADSSWTFARQDGSIFSLGDLMQGRITAAAWIEPEREPSKHLLRELGELEAEISRLGLPIMVAIGEEEAAGRLPQGTILVRDSEWHVLKQAAQPFGGDLAGMPFVIVIDEQGRIRYQSSGYKLGVGRELVQAVIRLQSR